MAPAFAFIRRKRNCKICSPRVKSWFSCRLKHTRAVVFARPFLKPVFKAERHGFLRAYKLKADSPSFWKRILQCMGIGWLCIFSFCCNRRTNDSRTFLPCIQNGAEPSRRCLVGESPLLASSFARGLSDSVNLKRSSSCSFVCEIKKEPTVSFQNDWLRWQQKTAGSICCCLPSLYCIQLLLGFVSIFKGKTPFFHLRFWNFEKRPLGSKKAR